MDWLVVFHIDKRVEFTYSRRREPFSATFSGGKLSRGPQGSDGGGRGKRGAKGVGPFVRQLSEVLTYTHAQLSSLRPSMQEALPQHTAAIEGTTWKEKVKALGNMFPSVLVP